MKTILLIAALAASVNVYAQDSSLESIVARDLNSFFGDTVNEGDRTANVRWKTEDGKAVPRVECREASAAESERQVCDAEIAVKIDGVSEEVYTTCTDLPYVREGQTVTRAEDGRSAFAACLEDISSAE